MSFGCMDATKQCPNCGSNEVHRSLTECVAALREALADAEIRGLECPVPRRKRRDRHFVMHQGVRMDLSEAAAMLGVTSRVLRDWIRRRHTGAGIPDLALLQVPLQRGRHR